MAPADTSTVVATMATEDVLADAPLFFESGVDAVQLHTERSDVPTSVCDPAARDNVQLAAPDSVPPPKLLSLGGWLPAVQYATASSIRTRFPSDPDESDPHNGPGFLIAHTPRRVLVGGEVVVSWMVKSESVEGQQHCEVSHESSIVQLPASG